MAQDWGIHTIAAGRRLGHRGFARSGAPARARRLGRARHRLGRTLTIRSDRCGFRPVRLGGIRRPGLLEVQVSCRWLGSPILRQARRPTGATRNRWPRRRARTHRPPPATTRRYALRTHPPLPHNASVGHDRRPHSAPGTTPYAFWNFADFLSFAHTIPPPRAEQR